MTVSREELVEALRPLAAAADYFDGRGGGYDDALLWSAVGSKPRQVSVADARRARDLLRRLEAEAAPAPADTSGRAAAKQIAANLYRSSDNPSFNESWLIEAVTAALASEYERGLAAGEISGREKAAASIRCVLGLIGTDASIEEVRAAFSTTVQP